MLDSDFHYGAHCALLLLEMNAQDVVLFVPMETMKDVERVKQAFAFEGMNSLTSLGRTCILAFCHLGIA